MNTADRRRECTFCMKFGEPNAQCQEWFDVELTSCGRCVVAPGLGPPVEGYLMLISRDHYVNVAQLPRKTLRDLSVLKRRVREVLTRCYSAPVFFEHGSGSEDPSGGSSIVHAHMHAVPVEIDLTSKLYQRHALRPIETLEQMASSVAHGEPYLFYEDQHGCMYVGSGYNIPSQYLRRLIADALGIGTEWDYTVAPRHELISATLHTLNPWPSD